MTEEPGLLLTIDQVARVLQVHPRTVRRAISGGGLRAFQVAGRGTWRVRAVDLDAWLEERANAPRAPTPIDLAPIAIAAARGRRPPLGAGRLAVTDGMGSR